MLDASTLAWLDQDDRDVAASIRRHGWHITAVYGCMCSSECAEPADCGRTGFAYTVGLFGLGHPELLVFSLPMNTAAAVLNELATRVRSGADLLPGQLLEFADWKHRVVCEDVPNTGDIVFSANRLMPTCYRSGSSSGPMKPWHREYGSCEAP